MPLSNALIKTGVKATAVTALAGAAPQTGAGAAIDMIYVETGSLSAKVYAQATTNLLTIAAKWQVSDDGQTWIDAVLPNNPANVVLVTGTGSAVPGTKDVAAPAGVYGHKKARCVVLTAAATAGTGDEWSMSYNYRAT